MIKFDQLIIVVLEYWGWLIYVLVVAEPQLAFIIRTCRIKYATLRQEACMKISTCNHLNFVSTIRQNHLARKIFNMCPIVLAKS